MGWTEIVGEARRGRGVLRHARSILAALRQFRLPVFRPLVAVLYAERDLRQRLWPIFVRILYREPLLRYRCERVGPGLDLYGSMPWIAGDGRISIGDRVMLGGRNSWVVGYPHTGVAELIIGDRTVIGYQNVFSVARRIRIGSDTMLAANVQIYDNPTHALSPGARLRNEPFPVEEAVPVEVGNNVWIGTDAIILSGVTIGDGAVVGAGSIVTKDVAPNTLVAGNPARMIKVLDPVEVRD